MIVVYLAVVRSRECANVQEMRLARGHTYTLFSAVLSGARDRCDDVGHRHAHVRDPFNGGFERHGEKG